MLLRRKYDDLRKETIKLNNENHHLHNENLDLKRDIRVQRSNSHEVFIYQDVKIKKLHQQRTMLLLSILLIVIVLFTFIFYYTDSMIILNHRNNFVLWVYNHIHNKTETIWTKITEYCIL